MKELFNKIQAFLIGKEKGKDVGVSPSGTCPVCWGHSEWEGQYYEIVRDKHLTPGDSIYDSFISKIVDKHVKTTHKHENKYICITCDKEI